MRPIGGSAEGYILYHVPCSSMYDEDGDFDEDGGDYDYSHYDILDEDENVVGNQDDFEVK